MGSWILGTWKFGTLTFGTWTLDTSFGTLTFGTWTSDTWRFGTRTAMDSLYCDIGYLDIRDLDM